MNSNELILLPAVDVVDGRAVRLVQGKAGSETEYGSALEAALTWQRDGAEWIHLVDLDAAFGRGSNAALLAEVVGVLDVKVEMSGGIRDDASLRAALATGCARVNIGTAALENPQFVRDMAAAFPGGIVVAVDARDGMVATKGWADVSTTSAIDLARRFEDAGVAALLFTDVGRDGLLKGCNVEATVDLARAVDIPVIASGGVKGIGDIHVLALHARDGVEGVITGRALYDGRLDLAAAISVAAAA